MTGLTGEPSPVLAEHRLASSTQSAHSFGKLRLAAGKWTPQQDRRPSSRLHNPLYCIVCTEFEVYFLMNVQLAVCFNMVKEINDMVFIKVPWVL